MRGYQAQQGREISRCLKELRQLPQGRAGRMPDEPEETAEAMLRNEPEGRPEPANDHAPQIAAGAGHAPGATARNEPGAPAVPAPGDIWEVDGVPLLDVWGQPRRHPLAAARILAPA